MYAFLYDLNSFLWRDFKRRNAVFQKLTFYSNYQCKTLGCILMVFSHTQTYKTFKLLEIEKKCHIHANLPLLIFYIFASLYYNIPLHLSQVFFSSSQFFPTPIKLWWNEIFNLSIRCLQASEDTTFLGTLLFSIVTFRIFKSWVFSLVKYILLADVYPEILEILYMKKANNICYNLYRRVNSARGIEWKLDF